MKRILKFIGLSRAKQPEPKLFIDILREYINRYAAENQLNERTLGHYEQRYRNIHLFLVSNKLTGLQLDQVRVRHMEMLRSWLLTNLKTCSRRHASLHIELCKRMMKYAVMMEYTGENYIAPVPAQRDKAKEIIHLTSQEVRRLVEYNFQSDIYTIVAKIFAFQCFTGLSYCEIYTYELVEINGRLWIDSKRDKTGRSEYVYLFDEAKAIHNYFNGKIPRIANQTCNRILKEIAGLLKINKPLTTHVGRKTHATLLDESGVDGDTIARQLRNTVRICNETYIGKSHRRTEGTMSRLGLNGTMLLTREAS